MREIDPHDPLAREIDRHLRALAPPRAPASLLPRILAATVGRAPVPWYAQQWQAWTADQRVAAASTVIVAVTSLLWILSTTPTGPWTQALLLELLPDGVSALIVRIESASDTLSRLWQMVGAPVAAIVVPVVLACAAACALGAVALRNLVPGGTSSS